MVRHPEYQKVFSDFSGIPVPSCDIDMLTFLPKHFIVLGEIKHESGTFKESQRNIYINLLNRYKYGGIILYVTHNQRVQDGAEKIDVSKCLVREYYFKGEWHFPKEEITVKDAIERLRVTLNGML